MIKSVNLAALRPDLAAVKYETHRRFQTQSVGFFLGQALIRTELFRDKGYLRGGLHGTQGSGKTPFAKGVLTALRPHYIIAGARNSQILTNCDSGMIRRYDMKMHGEGDNSQLNVARKEFGFRAKFPHGVDLIEHADLSDHTEFNFVMCIKRGIDSARDRYIALHLCEELEQDPVIINFLDYTSKLKVNEFFPKKDDPVQIVRPAPEQATL